MNATELLITIAPRGKVFAVVRTNQQVEGRVLPCLLQGRWVTRAGAEAAATKLDRNLGARVVLVDELKVEEVRDGH